MQKPAKQARIKKVQIATPCLAPWVNMPGDDRVRGCQKCSRNVYNVEVMDEFDLLQMIKQKEGKVDPRVFRRRDGTIITNDCPVSTFALGLRQAKIGFAALVVGLATPGLINMLVASSGDIHRLMAEDSTRIGRHFDAENLVQGLYPITVAIMDSRRAFEQADLVARMEPKLRLHKKQPQHWSR